MSNGLARSVGSAAVSLTAMGAIFSIMLMFGPTALASGLHAESSAQPDRDWMSSDGDRADLYVELLRLDALAELKALHVAKVSIVGGNVSLSFSDGRTTGRAIEDFAPREEVEIEIYYGWNNRLL